MTKELLQNKPDFERATNQEVKNLLDQALHEISEAFKGVRNIYDALKHRHEISRVMRGTMGNFLPSEPPSTPSKKATTTSSR